MLGGHDDLALERAAGERALLEDDDVLRGEAEVAVLLEEVDGRLHRARRRHDVPRNLARDPATFQVFGPNMYMHWVACQDARRNRSETEQPCLDSTFHTFSPPFPIIVEGRPEHEICK